MKKVLFALLLLSATTAGAQFTKGTRTVGINVSSIGYSNLTSTFEPTNGGVTGSSGNNNFNVSITPSMGWFLSENVLIGGNLNINFSGAKYTEGNYLESNANTFTGGVGGFGRYYFGKSGFMPYAQASLGIAFGSGTEKLSANYANYTTKGDGKKGGILAFNGGVGLGITKMLSKHTGLDIGLGYSFSSVSYKYSFEENRQYTNPSSSELLKTNYKYNGITHGGTASVGFLIFLDPKTKK